MYVQIVGFRSHIDSKYHLEKDKLTLLKGPSGSGKTTILQAIYWCLYGNMRNIYNNSIKSNKICNVTLTFPSFIIYRQKNPELLQITMTNGKNSNQDSVYEDIVAQQIIDSSFGSKELWKACSYIEQRNRCSLLSGTAKERMTLLNQLSFQTDDPKKYIESISSELKRVNQEFLQIQAVFTHNLNAFTQKLNDNPVTKYITVEQLCALKDKAKELDLHIQEVYLKVIAHERAVGSYQTILDQINNTNKQLVLVKEEYKSMTNTNNHVFFTLIEEYQDKIKHLTHTIAIMEAKYLVDQKIEDIIHKLIQYKDVKELDITVTPEIIWSTNSLEKKRLDYMDIVQKYGLQYDSEVIAQTIAKIQEDITNINMSQQYLSVYNKCQELESQYTNILKTFSLDTNNINQDYMASLEVKLSQLTVQIADMKKGLDVLSCPQCNNPLKYISGKLVCGDRKPVSMSDIQKLESDYQDKSRLLTGIRKGLSIKDQIKQLSSQLDGLDIESIVKNNNNSSNNISEIQNKLNTLSRIEVIPSPQYTSTTLQRYYEYSKLQSELNRHRDQSTNFLSRLSEEYKESSIDILKVELSRLERDLSLMISEQSKIVKLDSHINSLKNNLQSYYNQKTVLEKDLNPDANKEYKDKQEKLKRVKEDIVLGEYAINMQKKQETLTLERQKVVKYSQDVAALTRLKQSAIDVECQQLEGTILTINNTLEDILPYFFNEDITVLFKMYKVLKNKKTVKPGLNLIIKYKGCEYDNLNQLSGGEGDRISLAVILALNSVSNSPILMLDECISSLDAELKESCLNAIKSLSKTIICVDHTGVEGFYDQVISLQ